MNVRHWIGPAIGIALLGGVGVAAALTRETWMPYVLPQKKPAEGGEGASHAKGEGGGHAHPEQVKLSPQARENLKLETDQLDPQPYWRKLLIPGVVVDRPGESDRGVAARFAAVVEKVHAKPGDTVAAGDPLFTLRMVSDVVLGWQRDLATAKTTLVTETANRDLVAKQVADKVVAPNALVEPKKKVDVATAQVELLRRQLKAFGLSAGQIDEVEAGNIISEMVVAAPPAEEEGVATSITKKATVYEVQKLKVTLGEAVQAGQTLATLARHQKLYVEGMAFKSEAAALARLAEQKVPVSVEFTDDTPGEWPEQPPLVIDRLANEVEPATRTFSFFMPLDNQSRTFERDGKTRSVWRYRPGQRVQLRVPVQKIGDAVLVLPAGAVVREGGDAYAFVQNGDTFVRKAVRVLYDDRTDVVLADDGSLPAGAFVVKNQAAALNRAIKAQAAGGGGDPHAGHSHD